METQQDRSSSLRKVIYYFILKSASSHGVCVCLCIAAEHAQQALELDESVWQAHQWYAIAIGSLSKYESTQKKIEMGYKYKVGVDEGSSHFMSACLSPQEHIDRAISLNPVESTLHHLRGRFCFEVTVCETGE